MPLIDIGITNGEYWKGSGKGGGQIGKWVYIVFVVIFGLLGLDHLLLRSPVTFVLKLLTMIPFLGFWYFYDIAQLGEWDLIKKDGIGIPFYGPLGIGKGIFINEDSSNLSSPDIPKPWMFMGYVLLTLTFAVFPLNKMLIGDYTGAAAQLLMYFPGMLFFGIGVFLAVGWGFYDIYRVLFDTRNLFEKGVARIPPATWWPFSMNPYAKKGTMGPKKDDPEATSIVGAAIDATKQVITATRDATKQVITGTRDATKQVINATGNVTAAAIDATKSVTVDVVKSGAETLQGVTKEAGQTSEQIIHTGTTIAKTVENVAKKSGEATVKLVGLIPKIKTALDSQKGGGIISQSEPSSSSVIILFSVALLAASGYVMYTFRKTAGGTRNDREDDSPPDPNTVRRPS